VVDQLLAGFVGI